MFVYGDVVYAQTWQVLTVKNCIEPFSYASTAYVVASALILFLFDCFGQLAKFFGQMVYRHPPWQKIARTPMSCQNFIHHMTKKEPEPYVTYYHDICFGYSILKEMVNMITKFKSI